MKVDPTWILNLMLMTQAKAPWVDTYETSAVAIARAAEKHPAFAGEHGAEKTAAWLVSLAYYEGAFKPDALGDCDKKLPNGMCAPDGVPASFCMFQIHRSNLKGLGTTKEELLTDVNVCAERGAFLVSQSFKVCRSRPLEERLSWYAGGGNKCPSNNDATNKSKHRARRGIELFGKFPPASL